MNKNVFHHNNKNKGSQNNYYSHVRSDIFHLLPQSCDRILEIGVASGATINAIKELKRVSFSAGVELDSEIAEAARSHVHEVVSGNVEHLKLPSQWNNFDVILCLDVLEHLVDPWSVVADLHKRLKPGGAIIASLPNINFIKAVFPLLFFGKWELQDSGVLDRTHLRFFVRDTAVELMTSSGLSLDHVEAGGMPKRSKRLWCNRLTAGMFERFIAMQYYVRVVRKPS